MENIPELAFGIAALVYAASVIIWRLPLGFFKRHGWQGMMHGWSTVAVISVVGSLGLLKALLSPLESLLGVRLDATFEEALSSINMYREMVQEHIFAVNLSALALGGSMAIMLLALTVASISGVGVLVMSVASYLISAVIGLLLLAQKALSAVLLFADVVGSVTLVASVAGPGMFMAGLVLYATPFARKLGKTLLVVGGGLTLALPVVVAGALPSPAEAQREIEKSREIQVYSIALETVKSWQGGVRLNVYDRNGTILLKGGGEEFHRSRVVHYPYFKLSLRGFDASSIDCGNMTLPPGASCSDISRAVREMVGQPETGFINTGESYYNSYEEGYRVTLTMPQKHQQAGGGGPNPWREAEYLPDVWVLGMWIYMQGQTGRRDEPVKLVGLEIPEKPPKTEKWVCNDITCWLETVDPYEAWRSEWEEYWRTARYYKLYAENMVQEGEKTSLVWFTDAPVGLDTPLNLFTVLPPIQSLRCVVSGAESRGNETVNRYSLVVRVGEKTVTYFAYLEGAEFTVDGEPPVETREVDVGKLVGKVIKDGGPLSLPTSIEIVDGGPRLEASPPVRYMEVYFPGGDMAFGEGYTCEEAMVEYIDTMIEDLKLEDNSTNPHVDDYLKCYERERARYASGEDIIPEPGNSTQTNSTAIGPPPCAPAGAPIRLPVTVYFTLLKESPLAPFIALVDWEAFDKDEEYFSNTARGVYFNEGGLAFNGVDVETHREEWASYPTFRQGLYRDGPPHAGQRLVIGKLQEYKSMSWEKNPIAREVFKMLNSVFEKASETVPGGPVAIPVAKTLLGDGESVGMINIVKVAGYTIALAYGLLLFAVGLDSISWFIGGESLGKKLVGGAASIIYQAYSRGGAFMHAMRGKGTPSMVARREAKAQQDKMLRTFLEERRRDRERMERIVERRLAEERARPLGRLRALSLRERSKLYESMLDKAEELEGRGVLGRLGAWMLREASRGYVLDQHSYNLLRDPEYAKRHLDQSALVRQRSHVMMTGREWAEGFSKMLRDASPGRRVALVDQLARHPEVGGHIMWKTVLSRLSPAFSDKISAPASFKVASEASKPLIDSSRGYRPSIPYAYIPEFRTSPWSHRFASLGEVVGDIVRGELPKFLKTAGEGSDIPYVHSSEDPLKVWDEADRAIRSYRDYVRPLGPEEHAGLREALLREHVKPFGIDRQAPILDALRDMGPHEPHASLGRLSEDVRESFWWVDRDAVDMLSREGYTLSEAWDKIASESRRLGGGGASSSSHMLDVGGGSQSGKERGWWED